MERIVDLLEEKNQHLQAFKDLNHEELKNFSTGSFENLERFYNSREALLEMIRFVDVSIDDMQVGMETKVSIQDQYKRDILKALNSKNDLVTEILGQDLQILSLIESAKSNIIRELSQVRSTRKVVSAYKSKNADSTFDEEV